MSNSPPNFNEFVKTIASDVADVEGYLSPAEIRFLALLAAHPTADGSILEIGSFKGKSTIVIAKAAKLAGVETVFAVDPMISPSETDPDLHGEDSALPAFEKNLQHHEVSNSVNLFRMRSEELAPEWDRTIRFLWIDGDHTYEGTKKDLDRFAEHLSDGAIVAIHDVLHEFEGGIRVFAEDMLLSHNFGACGLVGSIAWGQFHKDTSYTEKFVDAKIALYRRISRLIPFVALGKQLTGFNKKKYKLLRSRVPHKEIDVDAWLTLVKRQS